MVAKQSAEPNIADLHVRLISTSTVISPSHDKNPTIHNRRIELTPWDLQFLYVDAIQKGILFLKPPTFHSQDLIHHLKTSLSTTLDYFPPLAGRLSAVKHDEHDNSFSYFITCNNMGAEFVHAVADGVTVSDILDSTYVPRIVHSFFRLNGVLNCHGVSKPLLAVQVTELVDGIFFGCTINHMVCDGSSFWHFFNSWSEISRTDNKNSNGIANLPDLDRWFLKGIDAPIRFTLPPSPRVEKLVQVTPLLQERVFHFSKEKIVELKAKANAEINDGDTIISSLQALLAHLWRFIIRNRSGIEPDQMIIYKVLIGDRPRLKHPPLPNHYFGNAVRTGFVTIKAGDLVEHGLGYAALKMNEMVASQTEETAKEYLESWAKNPKLFRIGGANGNDLMTGSSPRFNIYGTDFGWGRPIAVRSGAGNKYDGKLTVFPGREEGSVDIEACLLVETLLAIENDEDLMDVCSF